MNYYNENNPYAALALRDLVSQGRIPPGHVDDRSILEVNSNDLKGFTQCHFFAGVAGWPLALQLAGWDADRPIWTGSCPCQDFSNSGKGLGISGSRDLWPIFARLIIDAKAPVVFGEQVASAIAHGWLDRLCDDLEPEDYAIGSAVLPACSVKAVHKRERIYWVAESAVHGRERVQRSVAAQVPENGTPQALGAWDRTGNPFADWKVLLAKSDVRRMDDGVPSTLDIRPRLHAYGNAIVPQLASQFLLAWMEVAP